MSKTLPCHKLNMTTRNASKKKAAKFPTPNCFDVLSTAVEEQKIFDPPTAISTSEEPPTEVNDTQRKDKLLLLCESTTKKFDCINEDMKGSSFDVW